MSEIPESVPDGWEVVAFRRGKRGEWSLSPQGTPYQFICEETFGPVFIICRIAPICSWQHGVFAGGWITQDEDRSLWWWRDRPKRVDCEWVGSGKFYCPLAKTAAKFRDDLPWTERIQQVGPTIEAQLTEVSDAK